MHLTQGPKIAVQFDPCRNSVCRSNVHKQGDDVITEKLPLALGAAVIGQVSHRPLISSTVEPRLSEP